MLGDRPAACSSSPFRLNITRMSSKVCLRRDYGSEGYRFKSCRARYSPKHFRRYSGGKVFSRRVSMRATLETLLS